MVEGEEEEDWEAEHRAVLDWAWEEEESWAEARMDSFAAEVHSLLVAVPVDSLLLPLEAGVVKHNQEAEQLPLVVEDDCHSPAEAALSLLRLQQVEVQNLGAPTISHHFLHECKS